MFFTLTLTIFRLLIYLSVPKEPQSPQFNKFPQSRTVDEGSPFKATCALDDVETGRSHLYTPLLLFPSYYLSSSKDKLVFLKITFFLCFICIISNFVIV